MKKIVLILVSALALLVFPLSASGAIPDPTEYFYVNDFAGVLTDETSQHIIDVNDDLYARTGAQIVVTTVNFTDGSDMEKYSYEMFNQWKIGGKNNGMLLLLSIGDDNYYVQRGADLDVKFSAGEIGDIIDLYLEPYFASGDYDQGVMGTFDAFVSKLEKLYADSSVSQGGLTPISSAGDSSSQYSNDYSYSSQPYETVGRVWSVFGSFFFIIVIIIFVALIFGSIFGRGRRYYGGGYPRRGFFWGWGRHMGHNHHHMPPPPHHHNNPGGMGGQPRPNNPSNRSGGGGFTMGGGVGRSGGSSGSRPGGIGGSRSGGFGGGSRSGGGGFTRGGGVGRR